MYLCTDYKRAMLPLCIHPAELSYGSASVLQSDPVTTVVLAPTLMLDIHVFNFRHMRSCLM